MEEKIEATALKLLKEDQLHRNRSPLMIDERVIDEFLMVVPKLENVKDGGHFVMTYLLGSHSPHIPAPVPSQVGVDSLLDPPLPLAPAAGKDHRDAYFSWLKNLTPESTEQEKRQFIIVLNFLYMLFEIFILILLSIGLYSKNLK